MLSESEVGVLLDGLSALSETGPKKEGLDEEGEFAFYRGLQDAKSMLQHERTRAASLWAGAAT